MCDTAPRIVYDVAESARQLSISRSSLFLLMQRGECPSLMIAGRRLIARSDLLALVDRYRSDSENAAEHELPAALVEVGSTSANHR